VTGGQRRPGVPGGNRPGRAPHGQGLPPRRPDGTVYAATHGNGELYRLPWKAAQAENLGAPTATASFLWQVDTTSGGVACTGTFEGKHQGTLPPAGLRLRRRSGRLTIFAATGFPGGASVLHVDTEGPGVHRQPAPRRSQPFAARRLHALHESNDIPPTYQAELASLRVRRGA
jgi:hypothetical protein